MGVSMRDCVLIATQIGAEFYVQKEAGKSKQYHVVLDGKRSDFRVLGDAYQFMSDISLGSMYGDWVLATTAKDSEILGDSDAQTLNRAMETLGRWTERMKDNESVDTKTYSLAVDITGEIYEFLLRCDEMDQRKEGGRNLKA